LLGKFTAGNVDTAKKEDAPASAHRGTVPTGAKALRAFLVRGTKGAKQEAGDPVKEGRISRFTDNRESLSMKERTTWPPKGKGLTTRL